MFQKPMRELFSIRSVHTLNRTFLVSLQVFAKIATCYVQHSLLKMLELKMFAPKHKSTIKHGTNTIIFMSPQIWQNILLEIRN